MLQELLEALGGGAQRQDLTDLRSGIEVPDAEGYKNLAKGSLAATAGLGGDLENVAKAIVQARMGYADPRLEGDTFLPTSQEVGDSMGADVDSTGFGVGEFFSADPMSKLGKLGGIASLLVGRQTVRNPKRILKEGIYKRPSDLAREAEAMVAPESPALREVFGTSREELSDIAKRKGNVAGDFFKSPNPRGSAAAKDVMTPENEERLIEALMYAEKGAPRLTEGMQGWYVLDPLKDAFVERLGKERGLSQYSKWNALTAMNSPGSPVDWEIPRGSSAYMMDSMGRIDDWLKHAGTSAGARGKSFPKELLNVQGHPYHSTAHGKPIQKYLQHGAMQTKEPKVPLYRQASEAPELGFQTDAPVPDAHWSRAVGRGDTRGGSKAQWGKSASGSEMVDLAPWWQKSIAEELGIESVPAQARAWGLYAPQTGVETVIGAPKLEIIADAIMDTSRRLQVSPESALNMVIEGKAYAGK